MKQTFLELVNYIKNPILEKDDNQNLNYRFQLFFKILLLCIIVGFLCTPLFSLFEYFGIINMENHKVEEMFKNMDPANIILLGGIAVPFIEELFFRAPITLFKKPKAFKIAFYCFSIIFGLIHLSNFDITTAILLLAPIIVIPQLFAGFALGFLRVRFGLRWSILLHCVYNSIFLVFAILTETT